MSDSFEKFTVGLDSPGTRHFAITPSSSVLPNIPRVIYVGGGGTLELEDVNGISCTYNPVSNSYIIFRANKVLASSTATSLIGVY